VENPKNRSNNPLDSSQYASIQNQENVPKMAKAYLKPSLKTPYPNDGNPDLTKDPSLKWATKKEAAKTQEENHLLSPRTYYTDKLIFTFN
jgi:hypothetical protein